MKFIKGFDGVRGVSIILVILNHLGLYMYLPMTFFFQKRVWPLFSGLTGVQIFFGLSGFLITTVLQKELRRTNSINFKNFYIKRSLRLFPALLIFYSLIAFCMKMGWIPIDKTGILFALFYVYNFIPQYYYSGQLGHLWSLAVEEQFYFLLPLLLLFVRKFIMLILTFLIVIAVCFVFYFVLPNIYLGTYPYGNYLDKFFLIDRWFVPACAPIMIGSMAATIIMEKDQFQKLFNIQNRSKVFCVCLVLYLSPLYFPNILLASASIFQSASYTLLLCFIYFNQSSLLVKVLSFKSLAYIGKISYGLYIYQGFFLRTGPSLQSAMKVQAFPMNLLLAIVVAIVSYEFIEKPILKYKIRFQ
ncbi:MAG: acyltransferase [Ferruginibacter sp.]